MHREEKWKLGRQGPYRLENAAQRFGIVDVGGPMKSEHPKGTKARNVLAHLQTLQNGGTTRQFAMPEEAINHYIADQKNFLCRHTLMPKIFHATLFGHK